MTTTDPNDLLLGSGIPAAKFAAVGATVKGTVVRSESGQQTDFATGKPLTFDDGNPKMQVIITLQTDDRDPSVGDDNGQRKLYVRVGSQMHKAIAGALRSVNAKLDVGGTLAVKYDHDEPSQTKGFNPAKQYVAQYAPPAQGADLLATTAVAPAGVAADDLF